MTVMEERTSRGLYTMLLLGFVVMESVKEETLIASLAFLRTAELRPRPCERAVKDQGHDQ